MSRMSHAVTVVSHIATVARLRLEAASSEPVCCARVMRSRRSVIVLGLGLAVTISLVHLATHISSVGGRFLKTPLPLHSKLKARRPVPALNVTASLFSKEPEAPSMPQPRLKIVIVSYMRSGSTLCGNIMQAHPGVFYVYEPLLYLWDHYIPERKPANEVTLRHRTKALWRESKPVIPPPLDFLSYMFRCNMTSYNLDFLTNIAHSSAFVKSGCKRVKERSNVLNVTEPCARGVLERCDQSSAVVLKSVRLSMAEGRRLIQGDPSVRLVHLVRDPRGMLLSRMRFNDKSSGEMHKNYTMICRRMLADVRESKRIVEEQWGQVLTVRYEDLAQHPESITSTMFEFVGLEMLPSVTEYLRRISSSEAARRKGSYTGKNTFRKDPFKTAYKWRLDLPFDLIQRVDRACQDLYRALGYVTFRREDDLRDLSLPAKLQSYGEGLRTASLV